MLEIILIRHGQTDWNRDRRIMGRLPIPLNARGRRETRATGRILSRFVIDRIYTSPLRRAMETAREVARGRRIKIEKTAAAAEIHYGRWVGKTFDEVSDDKNYKLYHTTPKRAHPPGGEPMVAVQRRAVGLIERLRKKHRRGGRIIVVSHADVIKSILVRYLGLDLNDLLKLRVDNASLSVLWFHGGRERVLAVNCPPNPSFLFDRTDQLTVPTK